MPKGLLVFSQCFAPDVPHLYIFECLVDLKVTLIFSSKQLSWDSLVILYNFYTTNLLPEEDMLSLVSFSLQVLPKPFQSSTLQVSSVPLASQSASTPPTGGLGTSSMNASNLVLQNMIEQLKVKLLIQALHRQQHKQAIADFVPQLAPTPRLHYPAKTDNPVSEAHSHSLHPTTICCEPLPAPATEENVGTDRGTEEGEELVSVNQENPSLTWMASTTAISTVPSTMSSIKPPTPSQPPTPSIHLNDSQELSDILPNIMCRISEDDSGRCQVAAADAQGREPSSLANDTLDTSSLSFSELFHGVSDSIDNCSSLLGMLGQLKSASPAKDFKKGESGHGGLSSEVWYCDIVYSIEIWCQLLITVDTLMYRLQLQTSALKVSFVRPITLEIYVWQYLTCILSHYYYCM